MYPNLNDKHINDMLVNDTLAEFGSADRLLLYALLAPLPNSMLPALVFYFELPSYLDRLCCLLGNLWHGTPISLKMTWPAHPGGPVGDYWMN